MFFERRKSKIGLILVVFAAALFLICNIAGRYMAVDHLDSTLQPIRIPEGSMLPFTPQLEVIFPDFVAVIPLEVGPFTLVGATPLELNLRYVDEKGQREMDVSITQGRFLFERFAIPDFPNSWVLRNGMNGKTAYEIFARGFDSDGFSLNPYCALREGLASRLRSELAGQDDVALTGVAATGDDRNGQVWRIYRNSDDTLFRIDGTAYETGTNANISVRFEGKMKSQDMILQAFSKVIRFGPGDVWRNEVLADTCISDLPHDIEPIWETACRQAHLVALLINESDTIDIARRLYGEYLIEQDKKGIEDLYDEMHFDMHYVQGWEAFIKKMKNENSWLVKRIKKSAKSLN